MKSEIPTIVKLKKTYAELMATTGKYLRLIVINWNLIYIHGNLMAMSGHEWLAEILKHLEFDLPTILKLGKTRCEQMLERSLESHTSPPASHRYITYNLQATASAADLSNTR